MLAGIFASLTEFERELVHERAASRAAARLRGTAHRAATPTNPRPDPTGPANACAGGEALAELVTSYGVSRATICRALAATEHVPGSPTPAS